MGTDKKDQPEVSHHTGEMDYSSFEAENRRHRMWVMVGGLVFAAICAAAFIGTIESIGSMSAHVYGMFDASDPKKAK